MSKKQHRKRPLPDALPYRDCAGVMVLNNDGRVFVGRRISDDASNEYTWQMPQGGIDKGEDARAAALRELVEETGIRTDLVKIIAEHADWLSYDLPDDLIGVALKGRFRGQRQKWFAMRFLGDETDIDLKAGPQPEFSEWRWVDIEDLPKLIVPFKRHTYHQIVEAFRHLAKQSGGTTA